MLLSGEKWKENLGQFPESRTELKNGRIPYLNSTELKARNTVKERKYPVLRPTVCAVEAYERFSFERSVSAHPEEETQKTRHQLSVRQAQKGSYQERRFRLTIDGNI